MFDCLPRVYSDSFVFVNTCTAFDVQTRRAKYYSLQVWKPDHKLMIKRVPRQRLNWKWPEMTVKMIIIALKDILQSVLI